MSKRRGPKKKEKKGKKRNIRRYFCPALNVPNNLGNEISILDLILFFLIFIRISNERWEIERKIRVFASLAFAPHPY